MLGVVLLTFRVSFFEDLRGGIGPGDSVAYPSERSRAYKSGARGIVFAARKSLLTRHE